MDTTKLDELQTECEKVAQLLKEHEVGMFTWWDFLHDRMERINKLSSEMKLSTTLGRTAIRSVMKKEDLLLTKNQIDKFYVMPCSLTADCPYGINKRGGFETPCDKDGDCNKLTLSRQASLKTAKTIRDELHDARIEADIKGELLPIELLESRLDKLIKEVEDNVK
jgi:hypothetical protein